MIPFAIVTGTIHFLNGETLEIRCLDLGEFGFSFRMGLKRCDRIGLKTDGTCGLVADSHQVGLENLTDYIELDFFSFKDSEFKKCIVKKFRISEEQCEDGESALFYRIFRVDIDNEIYRNLAGRLRDEYLNYIDLKMNYSDVEMSEKLVGYPADMENLYSESYQLQRESVLGKCSIDSQYKTAFNKLSCGISLNDSKKLQRFMTEDEFYLEFYRDNFLDCIVGKRKPEYVYIGNQYCWKRMPDAELMKNAVARAKGLGITPVLMFSTVREQDLPEAERYLWEISRNVKAGIKQEIVVNDWGMLSLIQEKYSDLFRVTLGILLCKRQKDTRMKYRRGRDRLVELLQENSLNDSGYISYLQERYGVERVSYEACGYSYMGRLAGDLYVPYYQMNTAGNCTLYAICHNGSRGRLSDEFSCPGYCEQYRLLYPDMLGMEGVGNTLFGIDRDILSNFEYFNRCVENTGADRIILEYV